MVDARPAVAVIARPAVDIEACLEALRVAGVSEPDIVQIGLDGPAMARNRALAGCDSTVLALVEDDVLVEAGWFEALVEAWLSADEVVACIGGPLRAAFSGGRPGWLSDDLLDAFATLDLDSSPMSVDARRRTFHGGNVSFRTSALRAVGGFWPARGRPDGRDWFSAEHEAQRELARAGWRAAYVPGVAAQRLVEDDARRRVVLSRRLRYGARRALIGDARPKRAAVRQLATSAVGVPVALARGREQRAMDRAVRVAESAGELLAAPLVGAELQPVARATAFRASVPPPVPRRRKRRARDGPLILLYHRVVERESDPLGVCVSPANFIRQLEVLKGTRELVPLSEIVAGDASPRAAAVTFDDGYHDNLEHAAPALAAVGVPATLFVATGHVAENRGFWWDELARILRTASPDAAPALELELGGQRLSFRVAAKDQRLVTRRHLQSWLQPLAPGQIESALDSLRAWAGMPRGPVPESDRPLTPEELRAFVETPGLDAGGHTRWHRSLRHADAETQDAEIAGSRADLAGWLGAEPESFAYPFGTPGTDFDHVAVASVRAAGYSLAVTTRPGPFSGADRFMLPRLPVPDLGAGEFEAWLAGVRSRLSASS